MKGILFIPFSLLLMNFHIPVSSKTIQILPDSRDPLVIRTFFKKNTDWAIIKKKLTSSYEMGFKAYVEFLEDKKQENLTPSKLIKNGTGKYKHHFVFLADSITFCESENTVLCIDLYDKPGRSFRVIPSELWSIENNLSISNMDFVEFYENCDEKGIFRGFK